LTVEERLAKRLLAALPDIPRWLETRSPLLHGDCELLGLSEEPLSFVVVDRAVRLASIAGQPPAEAVRQAVAVVSEVGDVLAQEDNRQYVAGILGGWRPETAKLHLLADELALRTAAGASMRADPGVPLEPADVPPPDVRVVTFATLEGAPGVAPELRAELERALLRYLVVAAYTERGDPASFCYAVPTESLWDVSIETLAPYRNQGYAVQAVQYLVGLMWERRKKPVWGALESNVASLALAKKLGFRPVDTMVVMHPPA
jgi:hypothetical protein